MKFSKEKVFHGVESLKNMLIRNGATTEETSMERSKCRFLMKVQEGNVFSKDTGLIDHVLSQGSMVDSRIRRVVNEDRKYTYYYEPPIEEAETGTETEAVIGVAPDASVEQNRDIILSNIQDLLSRIQMNEKNHKPIQCIPDAFLKFFFFKMHKDTRYDILHFATIDRRQNLPQKMMNTMNTIKCELETVFNMFGLVKIKFMRFPFIIHPMALPDIFHSDSFSKEAPLGCIFKIQIGYQVHAYAYVHLDATIPGASYLMRHTPSSRCELMYLQ